MFRTKLKFKTSKLLKKRRKKIIIKVILYFLLISAFVGGLSFLSRAEFLSIKEIKIIGEGSVNKEEIIKIAENKIKGTMLGLFSKSNILLYPRYEIEIDILNQFKRILDVTVSIEKFSIMDIEIEERKAFALYCEVSPQNNDEECFYLDETGFIFGEAPNFSGNSFVKYYSTASARDGDNYFLEVEDFKQLNNFLNNISETFDVKVVKVINDSENLEISLNVETKLILDLDNDFEKAFENLALLVNELKTQKEIDSFNSLEKVDLQFGNKIFYKVR